MKNRVYSITVLFLIILSGIIFTSMTATSEWILYKQVQGVQFYYQEVSCDDPTNGLYQNQIRFKIINTTDFDLQINYKTQKWYDNQCSNCNDTSPEHFTSFELKAKSEIIGNCSNNQFQIFASFKDKPNVPKLTKFEIVDIIIKPILIHE
jgi:hypothetical protein